MAPTQVDEPRHSKEACNSSIGDSGRRLRHALLGKIMNVEVGIGCRMIYFPIVSPMVVTCELGRTAVLVSAMPSTVRERLTRASGPMMALKNSCIAAVLVYEVCQSEISIDGWRRNLQMLVMYVCGSSE